MKNIKYIIGLFLTLAFFASCEEDDKEFGAIIAPTNVEIADPVIQGQDLSNPDLVNGDGTGFVTFTATASNVISYSFNFGDGATEIVPSGVVKHRFTKVGVNKFTVIVSAIGTGGVASTTAVDVEVYSSFSDVEAENFLSGGVEGVGKTWYWAADKAANIGLGPNDKQADGSHTWPAWFASEPWHSDKLCMYDSEFVFTQSADGALTFEQMGLAYVPGTYAGNLGVDGDTCHGADVVPSLIGIKNVALIPSTSTATEDAVDPEYRGTTISFSDGGFMGYYVGASTIEIIEITNSTLYVRLTEPGFAWYARYQTEKPVQ